MGVILAGGTGSRLYPLTRVSNKHLLPVGRVPMIFHPIHTLLDAGIEEIAIVTGLNHMGDIVQLLGSGKDHGCCFTYKVQDEAGGIAQALGLVEDICRGRQVVVILGDNIFEDNIKTSVESFRLWAKTEPHAKIFLKEVPDPERYGVATLGNGNQVTEIIEKPTQPESNYAVTGLYMYGPEVFSIIRTLSPSKRGELEITDVNNAYLGYNALDADILKGYWTDAGTFTSLNRASQWAIDNS